MRQVISAVRLKGLYNFFTLKHCLDSITTKQPSLLSPNVGGCITQIIS